MSRTYTITDKQISSLHNGMCAMYRLKDIADDMFKRDSTINKLIEEAFKNIEPVKKDLMDKKDADFDRIYKLSDMIAKQHGIKYTRWSIYDIEHFDEKSNVPKGSKIFVGDVVTEVKGDTWLDLWKAVEEIAVKSISDSGWSGFGDHVFIERFVKNKGDDNSYEVWLGS